VGEPASLNALGLTTDTFFNEAETFNQATALRIFEGSSYTNSMQTETRKGEVYNSNEAFAHQAFACPIDMQPITKIGASMGLVEVFQTHHPQEGGIASRT